MEQRVHCMEHLHDNREITLKNNLTWQDVQGKNNYYTTFKIFFGM